MVCEIVKTGETPRLWIGRVIGLVLLFSAYSFVWFIGFSFDFRRLLTTLSW
jgi:hypothetical protein